MRDFHKSTIAVILCYMTYLVVSSVLGAEKVEYRGYLPVTLEEAESFANDLEDRVNGGDKTLLMEAGSDLNAHGAYYFFAKKTIPEHLKNPSKENQDAFYQTTHNVNKFLFKDTAEIQYVSSQPYGETSSITFRFDTYTVGRPGSFIKPTTYKDANCTFILVKRKSDNSIFLARCRLK